jgi:hypothetical protein
MPWNEIFQLTRAVGSIATAVLVLIAWQQIKPLKEQVRLAREQATTSFEDSLTEHYRKIMEDIPVDIWLGSDLRALDEERRDRCRDAIYRYIDLSQEQAFLHGRKRVTDDAWSSCSESIKLNMKLLAFAEVWGQVKEKYPDTFRELRALLA